MRRSSKTFLERVRGTEAPEAPACRGTSRKTDCAPPEGISRSQANAPDARPVSSRISARRRHFPFQKKIRDRPGVERGGAESRRERGSPRSCACRSPSPSRSEKESASIRATPCGAFRNCVGGFTRNGRTATKSRTRADAAPAFRTRYRARRTDDPGEAVHERRHVEGQVAGLPRHRRNREIAPLERRARSRRRSTSRACPSAKRNGSSEKEPFPGSSAPSSPTRTSSVSASTPATVQYVCSPRNARGICPSRLRLGDRRDEVVRRRRPVHWLHVDPRQTEIARRQNEPDEPRLGLGQMEPRAARAAVLDAADGRQRASVGRDLDGEARGHGGAGQSTTRPESSRSASEIDEDSSGGPRDAWLRQSRGLRPRGEHGLFDL